MKKVTLMAAFFLMVGLAAHAQDMEARKVILDNYLAAWSEPNAQKRIDYLNASFAENGEYSDPVSITKTRQQLSDLIGMYQAGDTKGVYFKLLAAPEYHNEIYGRFDWVMMSPANDVLLVGMDFVTFGADGKVVKITGFFDPNDL